MNDKKRRTIALGAILAAVSVVLGAIGAHALKGQISPEHLDIFELAVRFQFYHSLGLILLGLTASELDIKIPSLLFIIGMILFCGSLYIISTRSLLEADGLRKLGMITPLGGLSFIAGWLIFAFKALRKKA